MVTYLRRALASVSNEDRLHGTIADTCCTAASSGTSCKQTKYEHYNFRGHGNISIQALHSFQKMPCHSLSWTATVAVALLDVGFVAVVPHQLLQHIWEGQV